MTTLQLFSEALVRAQSLAHKAGTREDQELLEKALAEFASLGEHPLEWEDRIGYDNWFKKHYKDEYISDEDFKSLEFILNRIALEEGGIDCGGDRRVQVRVVHGKTHQKMHFVPLPHLYLGSSDEDFLRFWRAAQTNLAMANDAMRMADFEIRERIGGEGE